MNKLKLMAVFAHPDDEAFGTGGTMAKYSAEGVEVYLVTATRGEVGEIADPSLATPETLGMVRENELRCACAEMGVKELRFLDCIDGQLETCRPQETLGKIVLAMRQLKPQVVFTFGPEGIYGHPDHIAIHRMATEAFRMAGDPTAYSEQIGGGLEVYAPQKLYYRVVVRDSFRRMLQRAAQTGVDIDFGDIDAVQFGSEASEITTIIDVEDYVEVKRRALECHRTQLPPKNPFRALPPEQWRDFAKTEEFRLAISRVGKPEGIETDLFWGIR